MTAKYHNTIRAECARIAQDGACNPSPLIKALGDGIAEIRRENPGADTPAILNDPALRLIVHQLAHLFRIEEFNLVEDRAVDAYAAAMRAVGAEGV